MIDIAEFQDEFTQDLVPRLPPHCHQQDRACIDCMRLILGIGDNGSGETLRYPSSLKQAIEEYEMSITKIASACLDYDVIMKRGTFSDYDFGQDIVLNFKKNTEGKLKIIYPIVCGIICAVKHDVVPEGK